MAHIQTTWAEDQRGAKRNTAQHFPRGYEFFLTFAASKESFPETRQNFLASLAAHPELKSHLAKEFWFGGEKIYELYEVIRSSPGG